MNPPSRRRTHAAVKAAAIATAAATLAGGAAAPAALAAAPPQAAQHPQKASVHLTAKPSRHEVWAGQKLSVKVAAKDQAAGGSPDASLKGRRVELQVRSHHSWRTATRARLDHRGHAKLVWHAKSNRVQKMRVKVDGTPTSRPAARELGQIAVMKKTVASDYGPGGPLACGGTYTSGKLGVANKTLPCGTKVRLSYHGRSVTVPVIDRGPYVSGRTWDLTQAAKQKLHFSGLGTVGSAVVAK